MVGDIALWSGIATGADAIVIPEREYDIEAIANKISENRKTVKIGLIVLAEGVMGAAEFKESLINTVILIVAITLDISTWW